MAAEIDHKTLTVNGIRMHVAESGRGPIILFLHGFPECWYTWRHQIRFFASRGYRAVAPDLRGFADTSGVPASVPAAFTSIHVAGDLVALIEAVAPPGEGKVLVVGHDWGALVAWSLCLYRPDKVNALVNLSVPFSRRNPGRKPLETLRAVYGDEYYICRFQKPGEIEEEFAQIGVKNVVKYFLTYRNPGPLYLPKGKPFPDNPISLPSWLSQEDVDYYATKYEATGFAGALNYYRALDMNWELTAVWTGCQVKVPVKFMVGDEDLTYNAPGAKEYIEKGGLKKDVPMLKEVVVLKGVAHFIHEEKPDEVNAHILSFLKNCSTHNCSAL
ncbi:alpha/beta-Hydrolases superfamily protein [Striga asiatica]|uniref:soluble epoxide hydrolase n=1 Tax=Striga asiatica TaxID=4170 RepID=A0A5A7PL52_STRAF|nr:alpha/beta-Hydrolases superfamily protein [Striga asiatica]